MISKASRTSSSRVTRSAGSTDDTLASPSCHAAMSCGRSRRVDADLM
ncbi:Uncharacterised protein [Mycobacterium tuberculosis]|uniref:Uncharacterized protein n=1 Tax=Mycobacterium tuberculosis TaxID=1773 RepID=A0A916LAG7_MYCTX|nr:Uncharacterised protein [Mycobacterium tuberculosis]COZ93243.1 Uncharacterised protein [Mycobacterium tuberculosis]CPA93862.1 Uncharacterised protein [Mycobacterium tuberculosis]